MEKEFDKQTVDSRFQNDLKVNNLGTLKRVRELLAGHLENPPEGATAEQLEATRERVAALDAEIIVRELPSR